MSFGIKLKTLRTYRKLTMKELGIAAGFPESSADVRISQYESDVRIPKVEIIEKLASALQVHPKFLAVSETSLAEDIMHMLLSLDKENTIRFHEEEYTNIQGVSSTDVYVSDIGLNQYFSDWNKIKKALQRGEITLEQYDQWRMNWPNKPEWLK